MSQTLGADQTYPSVTLFLSLQEELETVNCFLLAVALKKKECNSDVVPQVCLMRDNSRSMFRSLISMVADQPSSLPHS